MSVFDSKISSLWKRLSDWLQVNSPPTFETLRPGAGEERIRYLEEGFGFHFPPPIRTFFGLVEGQGTDAPCGLFEGWSLLNFEELLQEWEALGDALTSAPTAEAIAFHGPLKRVYATRGWIPFATDFGGGLLCFDLEPGLGGQVGQILELDHEGSHRRVLAPSLELFLEKMITDLESGRTLLDDAVYRPESVRIDGAAQLRPGNVCSHPRLAEIGLSISVVEPEEDGFGGSELALALEEDQTVELGEVRLETPDGKVLSTRSASLARFDRHLRSFTSVRILGWDRNLPPDAQLVVGFFHLERPWLAR